MTYYHFFNCVVLAFAPSLIVYKAILSEGSCLQVSIFSGIAYLVAQLAELIVEGTIMNTTEVPSFNLIRVLVRAVISGLDFVAMWFILRKHLRYPDMIGVGVGWSVMESLAMRLIPLWMGARGQEFSFQYLLTAIDANIFLLFHVAVATLLFVHMRKNTNPQILVFAKTALVFSLALQPILMYLEHHSGLKYVGMISAYEPHLPMMMKCGWATILGVVAFQLSHVPTVEKKVGKKEN